MTIKTIVTDKAPGAIGPYVQGNIAGDFLLHLVKFPWTPQPVRLSAKQSQSKQIK